MFECYNDSTLFIGGFMTGGKDANAHHLMRVRIKKSVFERLEELAQEETARARETVTVSDLVRAAVAHYLVLHESVRRLEHALDGEILIITSSIV